MPRCSNSGKFESLEFQDPEVQNLDIDQDGNVAAEVCIVRACAECGDESKTADLALEEDISANPEIYPHTASGSMEHEQEVMASALHDAIVAGHGQALAGGGHLLAELLPSFEDLDYCEGWLHSIDRERQRAVYEAACKLLDIEPEVFPEHELEIDEESVDGTERSEGKGRGTRTFFGANVNYVVRCACTGADKPIYEGSMQDEVQASEMEGDDSH